MMYLRVGRAEVERKPHWSLMLLEDREQFKCEGLYRQTHPRRTDGTDIACATAHEAVSHAARSREVGGVSPM